jgi:hypothetical protein
MDTGTTAGDEVLEVGARVGRLGERSSLVRRPSGRRGKRKGLRLISHGAIEQGRYEREGFFSYFGSFCK